VVIAADRPRKKNAFHKTMNFFEKTTDTIGWVKLFLSPFLLGLVIGGAMFLMSDNTLVRIGGVAVFILGIFVGVFVADSAKKAGGTQETIAKLNNTPDWDEMSEKMYQKDQERNKK
jgi:hypothetical protein